MQCRYPASRKLIYTSSWLSGSGVFKYDGGTEAENSAITGTLHETHPIREIYYFINKIYNYLGHRRKRILLSVYLCAQTP